MVAAQPAVPTRRKDIHTFKIVGAYRIRPQVCIVVFRYISMHYTFGRNRFAPTRIVYTGRIYSINPPELDLNTI